MLPVSFISIGLRLNPLGLHSNYVINISRGLRYTKKVFRTELPRYKKDLRTLPPLTNLLTGSQRELTDLDKLRAEKCQVYKEYLPVKANTILLEAIFHEDNDMDRLLRIIDENLVTMNSFYLGICFEAIDDMIRLDACDPAWVIAAPEFAKLCTKALYKMRFFEADEVLKVLKCLSSVQLPENTLLVQAALQMARHLINDFDLDELDCLDETLNSIPPGEKSDSKSLIRALKMAIPIAARNQVDQKQIPSTRIETMAIEDKKPNE